MFIIVLRSIKKLVNFTMKQVVGMDESDFNSNNYNTMDHIIILLSIIVNSSPITFKSKQIFYICFNLKDVSVVFKVRIY